MGTEVESPNSNHHVSQVISESFLFLEGEDGGAANGNGSCELHEESLTSPKVSPTENDLVAALNDNSPVVDNSNDGAGRSAAVSDKEIRLEFQDLSIDKKEESAVDTVPSPCDKHTQGLTKDGVNSREECTHGEVHTGESGSIHPAMSSDELSEAPVDSVRNSQEVRDVSITVDSQTCDSLAENEGCKLGENIDVNIPAGDAALGQITPTQDKHEEKAPASTRDSTSTADAYEAHLKEQASIIVGKVLNCNSLREALKKSQAWRKKRQLFAGREPITVPTVQHGSRRPTDQACGDTRRDINTGGEPKVSSQKSLSNSCTGQNCSADPSSQSTNQVSSSGTTASAPEGTSATREGCSPREYPQPELFDDRSCETTCTVAACAAVKLRRKKSEVGSRPGVEGQASRDSPTSTPGQSPVSTKRHVLRSPVLRIKHEWNSVEIASDSDSPRHSEDSDDDDDAGIYAESYRQSQWLYIGGTPRASSENLLDDSSSVFSASLADVMTDSSDPGGGLKKETRTASVDSGLGQSESSPRLYKQRNRDDDLPPTLPRRPRHHRSESISTTASEIEFRKRYQAKTKRIVHRKSSTQTYQRMSERFYDEERSAVVEKGPADTTFGFHIKGHHPVMVSTVETNSPAELAGIKVGDAVIAVNDVNVMEVSHSEAIRLIGQDATRVKLTLATDQRVLSDVPLCSGFLVKQGGAGILKNWRRRWFLLKQDHCLYYYKTEEDKDPLGAIMLTNYTVTKALEANRKHTFKACKFGQRTYYFQAESEDDMNRWASALSNAAKATTKTDTWLDVSSHNVGLPALSIKSPDCHGHLTKMGNRRKNWKRRYCVLKDACLYYYIDLTSSTAQGVAHLHGYTVEENLPFNKKFGYTLVPPDTGMRTFYFYADNETDMKRWITALQKSIGRWVREEDEEEDEGGD